MSAVSAPAGARADGNTANAHQARLVNPSVPHSPAVIGRRERFYSLAGVMLALLLAGLDQTIVSTAGPAIQRDLAIEPALYAWITTSYLVASTVMLPIYGKLSDTFGRKPILLVGVGLFLLGSALCGIAPTATQLILYRAVQGLGAAALFTTALAVIADLFPPAERGRYTGLISGVWGIASVIGPLVGGFITDRFGWHWAFFVNLPVGAVALWMIITRMPNFVRHGGDRPRVDVLGAALLVVAVVPFLLALSLGRSAGMEGQGGWPWASWQVLSMFAIAAVAAVAFLFVERRAADPIVHLEIFRTRVITAGVAAMFVLGSVFLFAVIFLPLFLVNVVGVSATRAGLTMMPLTLAVVAGSIGSGQLVTRLGRYKGLMLGGLVVLAVSFAYMALTLSVASTLGGITIGMVLMGLGIGPTMPLYSLATQNAARASEIGVVTAAGTFARSLGQVIGVAVCGTVFALALASGIRRESALATQGLSPDLVTLVAAGTTPGSAAVVENAGGEGPAPSLAFDAAAARQRIRDRAASGQLSAAEVRTAESALDRMTLGVKRAFTDAMRRLYQLALAVVVVAFAITLMIPQLPLRRHHGVTEPAE
jgi:EmrB/QacA subfamily drug resistance transporter